MKIQNKAIIIGAIATIVDVVMKYLSIKQPNLGCFGNIFCFSLFKNYGIAFSFQIPMLLTIILSLAIVSIIFVYLYKHLKTKPYISSGIILILFGALNNLIDRLINNFTTDYIIFFGLSAINLADILILAGAFIILWYSRCKEDNRA
jgi:lipoprotein signal peptidase